MELNDGQFPFISQIKVATVLFERSEDLHHLQTLTETLGVGLWHWHVVSGQMTYNRAIQSILGLTEGDVLSINNLLYPDDMQHTQQALYALLSGPADTLDVQCRIRHAAGYFVWVRVLAAVAQRDEAGAPLVVAGFLRDISDYKAALNAQAAHRTQLDTVLQAADLGFWDFDIANGKVSYNQKVAQMLGYSVAEYAALGDRFQIEVHPEDLPIFQKRYLAILDGHHTKFDTEARLITKEGGFIWVYASGRVIERGATGRPTRMVGTLKDITQRKQNDAAQTTELVLQAKLEEAQRLNDVRERFIQTVNHEFRTPLTSILLSAQSLEHHLEKLTPQRRQKHLVNIRQQVNHITNMMEAVLTLDHAMTSPIAPVQRFHAVRPFFETLFNYARQQTPRTLDLSIVDEVEQAYFDQYGMQIIFRTLVANAEQYSSPNETIFIHVTCTSNRLDLVIKNRGIGIPEDEVERIFELFYRGHNVQNIKGIGLGLSLVKYIVDQHWGKAFAQNLADGFTQFTVQIPNREGAHG